MDSNIVSGLIGLGGACIGGLITILVARQSFQYQKQQVDDNEKKLIQSLLQAIHDEIETVNDRYQETMGIKLENLKEGEGLYFYYPLVSDYFSVYNGNTFLIGRIDNNDLRKQIIKTYTLLKGMVDSFRLNNDLVHKYEYSLKIYDETEKEIHLQHAKAHEKNLIDYAKTLKEMHKNIKQDIAILLRVLRKQGVLSEIKK